MPAFTLFRNLLWLCRNSLFAPPDERNFFVIDWKKVEAGRESFLETKSWNGDTHNHPPLFCEDDYGKDCPTCESKSELVHSPEPRLVSLKEVSDHIQYTSLKELALTQAMLRLKTFKGLNIAEQEETV